MQPRPLPATTTHSLLIEVQYRNADPGCCRTAQCRCHGTPKPRPQHGAPHAGPAAWAATAAACQESPE